MKIDLEFYNDNWERDVNGLNFRGITAIENGTGIIKDAWLRVNVAYDNVVWNAFWDVIPGVGAAQMHGPIDTAKYDPQNRPPNQDYVLVPPKTRAIVLHGRRKSKAAIISAVVLPLAA